MATAAQITANKLNAQKSTGPKTESGKAKSSMNRLSHGFASQTAELIPGENPEEFKALLADLMGEYQPATTTEQILVEKMAQNQWISLRAFHLQSKVLVDNLYKMLKLPIPMDLGLLIRYHNSAERAFHRAHNELVKTQKERKNSQIGFESQDAPAEPPEAAPPTPPSPDFEAAASISVAEEDLPLQELVSAALQYDQNAA